MKSTLDERIADVKQKIERAAGDNGRAVDEITLVAVTKSWPVEVIVQAHAAGLRHFGENRTAELAQKRPLFEKAVGADKEVTWHFIGHLQSRQSRSVAEHADFFHAADRLKIIARLGRDLSQISRSLPFLLEVNISGESAKSGFEASDWENDPGQRLFLREALQESEEQTGLACLGFMTMAPWQVDPAVIRAVFRRTRRLRDHLQQEIGRALPVLSMGMTDDFELAIAEGATHIRVGRALFGSRTP